MIRYAGNIVPRGISISREKSRGVAKRRRCSEKAEA